MSASGSDGRRRHEPRVSVVVLTYNRCNWLRGTLRRLVELPERVPIAVVDNGSSDGTADMVRAEFPEATLLRLPDNIGAAARNVGVDWARTPYVAFCDDDTWWHPGALTLAADMLDRHHDVASLTARLMVVREGREPETDGISHVMADSPIPSAGLPGKAILGLLAGASVFRTQAYRSAGGYHPRLFIGGEETLLALDLSALGWRLVYCPELVAYHQPCPVRAHRLRRRLLARNAIWSAWLRLPASAALAESLRTLPALMREGGLIGCLDTVRGLPWILRERAVIPPTVQALRRYLGPPQPR
ncbi:glycosyltransferase family 2 protein [Cupriavidus sp. AU9028]|uniref:glycosyltransferase family 2 protein n=1 Tax=Cupriavidus sp. AU9028 TaxID=2871157 RepID=UPI00351D325F